MLKYLLQLIIIDNQLEVEHLNVFVLADTSYALLDHFELHRFSVGQFENLVRNVLLPSRGSNELVLLTYHPSVKVQGDAAHLVVVSDVGVVRLYTDPFQRTDSDFASTFSSVV